MTSPDGLMVTFENLLLLTEHVEIHVQIDPGPFWTATLVELQASSCEFTGELWEQLELQSVAAAHSVLEGGSCAGEESYAAAVRVLALHHTGQLQETLDRIAIWGEGFWDEVGADDA